MKIIPIVLLFMMLFLTSCAKSIATTISEDDEWIVVSTFARGGFWDIYGVNTSNPQDTVRDMAFLGAYPSWSHDNQWIVYSTSYKSFQKTSEIYIAKSDGTNKTKVAEGDKPMWSPKDNKIIYTLLDEIYVLDISCFVDHKSCDTQPIAVAAGNDPDWSPDGQRVVFELDESIYVVNVDDTELREISVKPHGGCREPDWSPIDDKILFWCWGNNEGFYTTKSDGTDMTKIETGDMGGVSPKWSPSGKKIAFIHYLIISSVGESHSEVYVMNADGTDVTRLTFAESGLTFGFSWMPSHMKPETCDTFCQ